MRHVLSLYHDQRSGMKCWWVCSTPLCSGHPGFKSCSGGGLFYIFL